MPKSQQYKADGSSSPHTTSSSGLHNLFPNSVPCHCMSHGAIQLQSAYLVAAIAIAFQISRKLTPSSRDANSVQESLRCKMAVTNNGETFISCGGSTLGLMAKAPSWFLFRKTIPYQHCIQAQKSILPTKLNRLHRSLAVVFMPAVVWSMLESSEGLLSWSIQIQVHTISENCDEVMDFLDWCMPYNLSEAHSLRIMRCAETFYASLVCMP